MLAHALQGVASLAIRTLGDYGTVTLTRPNTLTASALFLSGAVLAGATSLTAQASDLEGMVKAGSIFTLEGVSGSYTVAADAEASGGAVALTFTPGLASGASSGADLTFSQTYGTVAFFRARGSLQVSEDQEQVKGGRVTYLLLAESGKPQPVEGIDQIDDLPLLKVQPLGSGPVTHYRVTVGAAP